MSKLRPILLQVAMEVECQEILKKLSSLKEKTIQGYRFYEGTINNYPLVVSLSKVGLIHTSASLTLAIQIYDPISIINLGIAGATSKEIHMKDIVIGERVININSYRTKTSAEGEGSNPKSWELLTFLSGEEDRLIEQSATKKLIELTKKVPSQGYGKVYYGKIGSGDVWNREFDRILFLNQKYQILCEDMESIATYTLANQWNIPVISIKMISDNALIGEEYNRQVGVYIQEYVLNYLTQLINDITLIEKLS
ncbi:MAG: 5'-methylthioadenosine/S-adenosylhomocysteine nucleosidase [Erysipelotrichaceae bacterium]|nr:5'-methylthioadenosine/S-adenosylhomocysteine nucleosidase [Erysipelotrichaceae bacterium]